MKISIITINFNNLTGLQKTINSVVSQTYKDFEWIIIDGGSTDGSRELIAGFSDYISYWVSEPDNGIYNAMNKGIRASHGEYLLFLNSGDYLYKDDVLERVVPLLRGTDFYVGKELTDYGALKDPKVDDPQELCRVLLELSLPHQSTFIHNRVFDTYGMYDETKRIVADWSLCYHSLILGNATIKKIPFIISVFDSSGLSNIQYRSCTAEKEGILSELSRFSRLTDFYRRNYYIVKALRSSRAVLFLCRVNTIFYRMRSNRK